MRRRQVAVLIGLSSVIGAGCMRDTVAQSRPTPAAVGKVPDEVVPPAQSPEEFGAVHWGRDLGSALQRSASSGKPVLLLFTEVPGCSTVRGFANGPLRHPLIVEAIEDEFEPVVIRNNVGGTEGEVLKSFGEPSWNNPVVRFIDDTRKDLAPRFATGWTEKGLVQSMVAALKSAKRPVPSYLANLAIELSATTETSMFSMYCFWTGEVKLAGLAGVVATRPGFANGHEVVEVVWDTQRTTARKLYAQAAAADAASGVVLLDKAQTAAATAQFARVEPIRGTFMASPKDDKMQLKQLGWGTGSMTPGQATALNRAVVVPGTAVESVLSPRQRATISSQ